MYKHVARVNIKEEMKLFKEVKRDSEKLRKLLTVYCIVDNNIKIC